MSLFVLPIELYVLFVKMNCGKCLLKWNVLLYIWCEKPSEGSAFIHSANGLAFVFSLVCHISSCCRHSLWCIFWTKKPKMNIIQPKICIGYYMWTKTGSGKSMACSWLHNSISICISCGLFFPMSYWIKCPSCKNCLIVFLCSILCSCRLSNIYSLCNGWVCNALGTAVTCLFTCSIVFYMCVYFLFAASPIMIVTEYMANGSLDSFLRVRIA